MAARKSLENQSKEGTPKQLEILLRTYKKTIESKGKPIEWSDSYLLKIRDQFRKTARRFRGIWTEDFFETLQDINRESIKRGLRPGT